MTSGSFEPFAAWWDEQVGETGDRFHQFLARPALYAALDGAEGLSVLDLGCGNGSAGRPLARFGAKVVGIDISPTLIARAQGYERTDPLGIRYAVADAARLPFSDGVFDRVSANMVMMDIDDAESTLSEVGRVLKPGGRMAMSLFHPCFQVPDGSSWLIEVEGFDERIARCIWRYREVFDLLGVSKPDQPAQHRYYHRPLNWYAERLRWAGLAIDTLAEPEAAPGLQESSPSFFQRQAVIPALLIVGAVKLG